MKIQLSILCLTLLTLGCASTQPKSEMATGNAPAENSERTPANEKRALKDKYGDSAVYFCTSDTAVVTIDPNKCKESMAKGAAGCTELAVYTSKKLKVRNNGTDMDLIDADGKAVHTLKANNDGFVLNGLRGKATPVKWAPLTDNETKMLSAWICK